MVDVYLETANKRVFAGALDWPGWCRSAKDPDGALQALIDYAPRYAKVLRRKRIPFKPPKDASALEVVERLKGDATTDFGAPGKPPKFDAKAMDKRQLARMEKILQACWAAIDSAVKAAKGKELRKGPRGGGRSLEKIVEHVVGADHGYLARIGGKYPGGDEIDPASLKRFRAAIIEALGASARGEVPRKGPRGGSRWTARFFVRRSVWHVLDHAWEIEDRIDGSAI
jgi:hypothetical protein